MYMIVNLTFLRTVWQECFSFFSTIKIYPLNAAENLVTIDVCL